MFSDEWDRRWIASACLAHPLSLLCSLFSHLGGNSVQTMSTGSLTPWFLVDSVNGRASRKSGRAESSGYNFLAPSLWGCWGLAVFLPSGSWGEVTASLRWHLSVTPSGFCNCSLLWFLSCLLMTFWIMAFHCFPSKLPYLGNSSVTKLPKFKGTLPFPSRVLFPFPDSYSTLEKVLIQYPW